jgi:acylphosphatase
MATRTVQVRIEGRVQGVGYRVFVEVHALELGLEGWVRNRRDGSVEAVFQGPDEAVDEMLQRCQEGPAAAKVDSVCRSATALAPIGLRSAPNGLSPLLLSLSRISPPGA